MTIYAVGDIQGCFDHLLQLLDKVNFKPGQDQLWSVGDIVNRGPKSLETLRFCKNLGQSFRMVQGNHDLHLLAVARGMAKARPKDSFDEIMAAPDREELLHWLQQQPLLIEDAGHVLVHAGIPPQWTLQEAKERAREVENQLTGNQANQFFATMYGNQPAGWDERLSGTERWRVITNYFTRMRFCDAQGNLELTVKTGPGQPPPGFAPWFSYPRKAHKNKIVFGHWASLQGKDCGKNLFPLDTGCVWGGPLRLMNLSTGEYTDTDL